MGSEMCIRDSLTPDKLAELLQLFATDMVPKTETIDSINEEENQNDD